MTMEYMNFGHLDSGVEEIIHRAHVDETYAATAMTTGERPMKRQKGIWQVRYDQINELPGIFPLEPTAVFVFVPNEHPSAISERISSELRDRSIEAYYDNHVAKAKCYTADGVDFRIQMYRGRGNFSHGIIVELQRRFGMSMNFHCDAMAVLDRAQGKHVPHSCKKNSVPLVSDSEDDYQADASSAFAIVARMMNSSCHDSQCMGREILCSITDVSKMGSSTARIVSKELMWAETEVGGQVLSLIIESMRKGDESLNSRTMSHTILANALVALQGNIPRILREQLEPVLLTDLWSAETNQWCAFQAARCAEWLLSHHNIIQYEAALKIAVEVGSRRHAALENQALKCLEKIMQSLQ